MLDVQIWRDVNIIVLQRVLRGNAGIEKRVHVSRIAPPHGGAEEIHENAYIREGIRLW